MKFVTDISLSTLHCILPPQVDDYWRYALVRVVLQVEAVAVLRGGQWGHAPPCENCSPCGPL